MSLLLSATGLLAVTVILCFAGPTTTVTLEQAQRNVFLAVM